MSSGGTVMQFKVGTAKASGGNARYISRERAVFTSHPGGAGPERSIASEKEKSGARITYIGRDGAGGVGQPRPGFALQNMPEAIANASTYDEMRRELASWASHRAAIEVKRHGERAGQARTHYRVIASYEKRVPTSVALAGAEEWAQRCFPGARVAIFVHQDTDHTHVHFWIDARKLDGSKIHLGHKTYRSLDEKWNEIYCRQMGRDVGEHLRKKAQAKAIKTALHDGWNLMQRPQRVAPPGPEVYQARDRRFQQQEARRTGKRSFAAYVREVAGRDFREAKSLGELNRRLGKKGLKVVSKGRGGVVRTLDETEEAKLSAVDRDFSWGKLRKAFEERREHRRQLGASLVGRLRRQHFGRQQDARAERREDNGVSAILARRVEATHLAGQGYLASVALSRQPRGEAREGRRQVRQGERGGAAGGDGHLSPVELEIPEHDSIFRADSASGEEEKEGPAAEEPEGPRPSETGESPAETADPSDEHAPEREAPPQSPDEAASAAEDGSEPSGKGEAQPAGEPSPARPENAEGERGERAGEKERREEAASETAPEADRAAPEPQAGDEKQAATKEETAAASPGPSQRSRGDESAEGKGQSVSDDEGDREIDEMVALGRRLQKLLKQVVEEKQRKEKRQQVLAELEERAKRAEKEFARRASPVARANLRRQLTQAEENLMDAYKRMREQKKKGADAEVSRSAEGQEEAGQPETEAGAGGPGAEGGDQPPASEQNRSDAGRDEASREGAASDVARRLASRAREIAKLDRMGKAASGQRAELAREARELKRRFLEVATDEDRRKLAQSLSDEEWQLVKRDFERERGAGAEKKDAEAASAPKAAGAGRKSRRPQGRRRGRHEVWQYAPRLDKNTVRQLRARFGLLKQRLQGGPENERGKQEDRGGPEDGEGGGGTGEDPERADTQPNKPSRSGRSVREQLRERLRALQILTVRARKAKGAQTPEEKLKAGAAVKQAREHYGTEPEVWKKVTELAERFVKQATDAERESFEASLPDEISRKRFRAAVQRSRGTPSQQRNGPGGGASRDAAEDPEPAGTQDAQQPNEFSRNTHLVKKQLREQLHALQILAARVEATWETQTPDERKEAAMALGKARERLGTRKAVWEKVVDLAARFAARSTEDERANFEASLPEGESRKRFRAAVQKSEPQKSKEAPGHQRGGPETDKERDPGDDFELEL